MIVTMTQNVTVKLGKLQDALRTKLEAEVQRQSLYFIGHIQRTQMTGRKGNIYLNVQTGTLRRSWFAETGHTSDGLVFTRVYSTTKYAAFHEYGTRFTPKRLFIEDAFQRDMAERYRKAFNKVLGDVT